MSSSAPTRSCAGPRRICPGGARPPVEVIVDFIDANRSELGVEPICRELQVAPSTYYAHKKRPLSARAVHDALMIPALLALWVDNYRVYGVRKLWKAARRAGHDLGRDQVARLMGAAGIEGRRKGAKRRTTRRDPAVARHPDLVKRDFSADAPNRLWVTDLTYVARGRDSPTCASSSTRSVARSWAGTSPPICAPTWSSTHSRWRAGGGARSSRVSLRTPTPARTTPQFATANAWPSSVCSLDRKRG